MKCSFGKYIKGFGDPSLTLRMTRLGWIMEGIAGWGRECPLSPAMPLHNLKADVIPNEVRNLQ
jgi:hypothetical protein